MSTVEKKSTPRRHWTAQELRKLPASRRNAILRAAAKRAERDYRTDQNLTHFAAFGEDDLHGDSANASPG